MSAAEDRMLLSEYAEWQTRDRDDSIDAFMQEREDRANTRRVAEALDVVDTALRAIANNSPEPMPAEQVGLRFQQVRDILEADRPWIDDGNITGESRRVYV